MKMAKKKKIDERKEFKPINDAGVCGACKYFYFNPRKNNSHYYLDEGTGQGQCIYRKGLQLGTTTSSKGCKHWKLLTLTVR